MDPAPEKKPLVTEIPAAMESSVTRVSLRSGAEFIDSIFSSLTLWTALVLSIFGIVFYAAYGSVRYFIFASYGFFFMEMSRFNLCRLHKLAMKVPFEGVTKAEFFSFRGRLTFCLAAQSIALWMWPLVARLNAGYLHGPNFLLVAYPFLAVVLQGYLVRMYWFTTKAANEVEAEMESREAATSVAEA